MDVSMKDDDCTMETVKLAKKKKLKQAQLPFQTLSSVKSTSNDSNIVFTKKKRKVTSPLVGNKSPKIYKFSKKDENIPEDQAEDIREKSDNEECILITDDEKDDSEQNDQRDDENKKINVTPKRSSLGKNKKLDKSQQKSGALTKFLKKADGKTKDTADNNDDARGSRVNEDRRHTSVQEEKDDVCSDESSKAQSSDESKSQVCQTNEKSRNLNVSDKDMKRSFLRQLDVVIVSLDNETPSELDKSTSNENEETEESATPVTPKADKDATKILKKLTPKQLEKKQETVRKKEEKLKLRLEKERKREEEKANRRKEKEEKQKEKEEKERMEKEQKKKEKELKELKKQMEIGQKQKDKEAKEEEKRRKEEEKLEAERRKQKAASNFASFFVSKKHEIKQMEDENVDEARYFMPFEIKADMKVAPVCRRILSECEKSLLDEKCDAHNADRSELYLGNLVRRGKIILRTWSKTWPLETKDDDVVLLDDDNDDTSNIIKDTHKLEKHRPKLLQFSENRRPPYWGTWRKRSKNLSARRPFTKDKKWFDYEIDSDDEWEEEEPGESLKGSDDEKDEESPEENEYDVDNEFMVPHGYLSDEEAQADEEEQEDMSPQTQKLKLKILGEQFEAERNTKTHKLKPKIIGCVWEAADNSLPAFVTPRIKEILLARRAWVRCVPIILPSSTTTTEDDSSVNRESNRTSAQPAKGPKKTKFPDEALADLIRLLHGNVHSRRFIMREFMTFWHRKNGGQLSKVSVLEKISDVAKRIACPEKGPMHLKSCWYVSEDIRKQQLLDDETLPLPNCWTYILTPNRKCKDVQSDVAEKSEREERDKEKEKEKERKHVPLITQFAKKITQEEMKKQLSKPEVEEVGKQSTSKLHTDQITATLPPLQRPPKRATLISVGRGEQFPQKRRMLDKFVDIKKQEKTSTSNKSRTAGDKSDVTFVESIDANVAKASRKKK